MRMAQAVVENTPLDIAEETRRLVTGRVMVLTLLGHMLLHLDRLNLGFASLEMNKALNLGPEIYGFGAGIFFLGYAFFEIPSNFALRRFGAPIWLGRIMGFCQRSRQERWKRQSLCE
jgi:ACS family tartrate transporter-like MFS transporter